MEKNTIAAIATSPGVGGIGIIRISGEEAFLVVSRVFRPKDAFFDASNPVPNVIKYGFIFDEKEKIDEVMVSFFKAPHSYTKENVAEINCHGGTVIMQRILEIVIKNGARMAEPGEFTKRAFLNGRIDLTQAEAIIDIITSKTDKARKISFNQLEGFLSEKINKIQSKLYDVLIQIEAGIDYPEHEIEDVTRETIFNVLTETKKEIEKLCNSFEEGRVLKEGVRTAILGKPNVGKSSLMNVLLREERAIVTDIPGTTRDTIEEIVNIRGIPLRIIDTAGIRKTDDKIEEIGVEKAKKEIEDADMLIAVFDVSRELTDEDFYIINLIKEKKAIIIVNKVDLKTKWDVKNIFGDKRVLDISAKEKIGIEELEDEIEKLWKNNNMSTTEDIIVSNMRHKELLLNSLTELNSAIKALNGDLPVDMLSINIRGILEYLGTITGQNVSEETINGIFSRFCLGK